MLQHAQHTQQGGTNNVTLREALLAAHGCQHEEVVTAAPWLCEKGAARHMQCRLGGIHAVGIQAMQTYMLHMCMASSRAVTWAGAESPHAWQARQRLRGVRGVRAAALGTLSVLVILDHRPHACRLVCLG
jgi:hypothetical protein